MATKDSIEQKQQAIVEGAVSKSEQFFDEHKTLIYGVLAAVLVIGIALLCWSRFYVQPKKAEASSQLYHAEQNFQAGNYELALNGDDNYPGFDEIIRTYGSKAGKAVYMYAGVSALQLGNFEDAIGYLKKYNGKDKILAARATACIGDAYAGLGEYTEAVSYFEKAAAVSDNQFSAGYLLKAGIASEELGQFDKALGYYKKIKDQYPGSFEGAEIDKYISRIEGRRE